MCPDVLRNQIGPELGAEQIEEIVTDIANQMARILSVYPFLKSIEIKVITPDNAEIAGDLCNNAAPQNWDDPDIDHLSNLTWEELKAELHIDGLDEDWFEDIV